jgi:DNA-binding response OmpR family regulator
MTSTPTDKPAASGKKILIIEDERPLAHALALKLEHEGYTVTTAGTGDEGMKAALAGGVDLILSDLIMPGTDGFAILSALKEKGSKIPVIVLSNLGQEEDKKRALDLGAKDYRVKANTPIAEILKIVQSSI